MRKVVAVFMMMCMLIYCSASAFAIVLPEYLDEDPSNDPVISEAEESESDSEDYYIDFTPYIGSTRDELNAFLDAKGLEKNCVTAKTANYTDANSESKFGINYISFEKSGIGALGFRLYGEFDRIITPEMEAEGWTLANNQFEGGFWYVTVNKTVGAAVYSVAMQLDGSKIFFLSVSVNDLNAHFSAQAE